MKIIKYNDTKNLFLIPNAPGVYLFYGKNKKLIYIGKACSLKERVKSHFKNPGFLLKKEIQGIKKIGFVKTQSEIEALLLEPKFIKKYQPKVNIMWKDDKKPFYVGITNEPLPKVFITHQPSASAKIKNQILNIKNTNQKSKISNFGLQPSRHPAALKDSFRISDFYYLGPFTDGKSLKLALRLLRKIFPYFTKPHGKLPCFYCHLGLCPGPNPDQKDYQKNIKKLIAILQGKQKSALKKLKKEMGLASKNQEFEKAAKIRDQIRALENIFAHHFYEVFYEVRPRKNRNSLKVLKKYLGLKKIPTRIEAYDISNIQGKSAAGSLAVFIDGKPDKSQYRKFRVRTKGTADDTAMLKEVIFRRFQHSEWPYPDLILADGGIAQLNAAKVTMQQFSNLAIPVISLAKKENLLYIEGQKNPIRINLWPDSCKLTILRLRDEAHRFAIAYHRKLRKTASGF